MLTTVRFTQTVNRLSMIFHEDRRQNLPPGRIDRLKCQPNDPP